VIKSEKTKRVKTFLKKKKIKKNQKKKLEDVKNFINNSEPKQI